MNNKIFPETEALASLQKAYQIYTGPRPGVLLEGNESVKAVTIHINNRKFDLYVYDEYNDLLEDNQLLGLCLVLRELEEYKEAEDYLAWCRQRGTNPDNREIRTYYLGLGNIYREIEQEIGPVDSQISDLDFQLNAGAAQWLRNPKQK